MNASRQKILNAVLKSQPAFVPLPELLVHPQAETNLVSQFTTVLEGIGGSVYTVRNMDDIRAIVNEKFDRQQRIATVLTEAAGMAELVTITQEPHSYQDVELMIMRAAFAVAENGAVWITEALMQQRILPFICQHLAVIVQEADIVATMQHAYERIGAAQYGFGSFISGPSKTADIEQALVLGAHGPRTMTVFLLQQATHN